MSRRARWSPISARAADGSRCDSHGVSGPNGSVYAVDVQRLMIEAISRRVQREGLHQRHPRARRVQRSPASGRRPDRRGAHRRCVSRDGGPRAAARNVARTLKPQGRIGIIDYREGEGGPGPDPAERVPPSGVIAEAAAAGLRLVDQHTFLTYQYFLIFGGSGTPSSCASRSPSPEAIRLRGAGIQADLKTFAAFGVYGVRA